MPARPKFTRYDGTVVPYAREDEVLAFANKIRAAGGADALDALLPSERSEPYSCLIANALNFGCSVSGIDDGRDEDDPWVMRTGQKTADEVRALAKALGCRTRRMNENGYPDRYGELVIQLPRLIGNAAEAFDEFHGWTTKYVRWQ